MLGISRLTAVTFLYLEHAGNKAKGQISKRISQENKSR